MQEFGHPKKNGPIIVIRKRVDLCWVQLPEGDDALEHGELYFFYPPQTTPTMLRVISWMVNRGVVPEVYLDWTFGTSRAAVLFAADFDKGFLEQIIIPEKWETLRHEVQRRPIIIGTEAEIKQSEEQVEEFLETVRLRGAFRMSVGCSGVRPHVHSQMLLTSLHKGFPSCLA